MQNILSWPAGFSVKILSELAACGRTLFDRINRIYRIYIYPDNPVILSQKWKFLYY